MPNLFHLTNFRETKTDPSGGYADGETSIGHDVKTGGELVADGATTLGSTITATGIHNSGGTGSDGAIASGTYTPTVTGVANVAAASGSGSWLRVGQVVYCSVALSVTATAGTTQTDVGISLPVASDFTSSNDCVGNGVAIITGDTIAGRIQGDTTNDRAELRFYSDSTTQRFHRLTFSYLVK